MKIDKKTVMKLLHDNDHPEADLAQSQLPQDIETEDEDHANLLGKYGIDPGDLPAA